MSSTATYVYCLVRSPKKPSLARAPTGVPGGAPPRAVAGAPGAWLIVSDVPLDRYGSAAIDAGLKNLDWVAERAMAHEAVVEYVARSADLVPMKLFTIFRDDERAIANVAERRDVAAIFKRIAGSSEWSVRMTAGAAPAKVHPTRSRARSGQTRAGGTAFLLRKKSERDATREAAAAARRAVEKVYDDLVRLARDAVRKEGDLAGTSVLLDAAFLVRRSHQAKFTSAARRLAATAHQAGCELTLSGPWPPYHFVAGA